MWLCNPIDCSTSGFPSIISWSWPKFMSIVSVMPSNHLILCHPLSFCLLSFPASRSLPMSQFFTSGGQSIGASASASVLPMSIQGWFPLRLAGLISLLPKGLSRVFSNTTVQKHQFLGALPSLWSSSHICTRLLGRQIALTIQTFVGKVTSLLFNTLSRFVIAFLSRSNHQHQPVIQVGPPYFHIQTLSWEWPEPHSVILFSCDVFDKVLVSG